MCRVSKKALFDPTTKKKMVTFIIIFSNPGGGLGPEPGRLLQAAGLERFGALHRPHHPRPPGWPGAPDCKTHSVDGRIR